MIQTRAKSDPLPPKRPKVILVDGHALLFRSYFSIKSMTTSGGEPVNAVFSFTRALLKLLKDKATTVIVVFDAPAKTFRHEQFEDYKAGRAKTPEDLPGQLLHVQKIIDLMGIPRIEQAGYEADDLIGSLAKRAELEGYRVEILTSDRDSYQLISEQVKVIRSDWTLMDAEGVLEKYGVRVDQWVDYRALTGDSSDNIPGAKGIGEKTAAKLIQDYETLDNILEEAQKGSLLPPKVGEKVQASREAVLFSRELSQMVTTLALDLSFSEALDRQPQTNQLIEFLEWLEFKSMVAEVRALAVSQGKMVPAPAAPAHSPLFDLPALERPAWQNPQNEVMWGFKVSKADDFAADLLEYGYIDGGNVYVSDSLEPTHFSEHFTHQTHLNAVGAKSLVTQLALRGVSLEAGDDPLLMAYVIDTATINEKELALRYAGCEWPQGSGERAQLSATLRSSLPEQMNAEQQKLYLEIEKPLSNVLAQMELRGVQLDVPYLKALSDQMGEQLTQLEGDIHQLAGKVFNIASRDQLEKVLYDDLGLSAGGKKTKISGKRSTAVSALEPLIDAHPMVPKLLEYRELAKLKGTYLDPLPSMILPQTGRLHTTFVQTLVSTGRLSSINPNLQNIPVRSEIGRQIRKGFVAAAGYTLLSADYSQIELRLMAHIADDPQMIQAFRDGADIHRRTAAQILGIQEDLVDSQARRAAKTVNFGVLYGMSAHRLSKELGISHSDAKKFIERYFGLYPGIQAYIQRTLEFCRQEGYVQTLLGRRRYVADIQSSNHNTREAAERVAYNMPIQGTAADIMKIAMVRLEPKLVGLGAKMLLTVHDELVVEAPISRALEVTEVLKLEMRGAYELSVPLEVEVGAGENWFDAK
jgi:DNA polymerase I